MKSRSHQHHMESVKLTNGQIVYLRVGTIDENEYIRVVSAMIDDTGFVLVYNIVTDPVELTDDVLVDLQDELFMKYSGNTRLKWGKYINSIIYMTQSYHLWFRLDLFCEIYRRIYNEVL